MARKRRKWKRKCDHPPVDRRLAINRVRYFIPDGEDTPVTNQKQEGTCQKWATADMLSIILRRDFHGLVASVQILIDRDPILPDLIDLCVDEDKGLESINDYPVVRYPTITADEEWVEAMYQTARKERFRLQGLTYVDDLNEIIDRILGMFCEGGYRYPCVCVMHLGALIDPVLALQHALGTLPPYRHLTPVPKDNKFEATWSHGLEHAMLITGVDTTSRDSNRHYCEVKNTHGSSWGLNGKSRVAFEVFDYVLFPSYKQKDERQKEKLQKKLTKKRKLQEQERNNVEEIPQGVDNDDCGDAGGIRSIKMRKKQHDQEKPWDEAGGSSGTRARG